MNDENNLKTKANFNKISNGTSFKIDRICLFKRIIKGHDASLSELVKLLKIS
jgi:hypothetical protein